MERLASAVLTLNNTLRRSLRTPIEAATGLRGTSRGFGAALRPRRRGRDREFSQATLLNGIDFKTAGSGSDRRAQDQILQLSHKLAMAEEWDLWSADLCQAERELSHARDGTRHHDLMMRGALRIVERAIERGEWPRAHDAVARYAKALAAAPADPLRAALAARARIALALGLQVPGSAADIGPDAQQEVQQEVQRHVATAQEILASFAAAPGPVLAEARYRATIPTGRAADLLPDLYAAWADCDPGNAAPMALHGRYLLPRCGGDYPDVELEARRAALRTEPVLGFAGYAMLAQPLLTEEPGLCSVLDPALLIDGIDDWLSALPEPHLVNTLLSALWDLARGSIPSLAGSEAAKDLQAYVAECLPDLVRRHLRSISPEAWGNDLERVRLVLADAYRPHLRTGGRVLLTPDGATLEPAPSSRPNTKSKDKAVPQTLTKPTEA